MRQWRRRLCRNTPITCRCTGRRRFMPGRASTSIVRPWRIGSAAPPSCCGRFKGSAKLFADETTAPVLDPGRGRTKTGQLWAYARDDRPWGGADPPGVVYVYAPTARLIGRSRTSMASRASCRSMAMAAIACSLSAAMSSSPSAGPMSVAAFISSLLPAAPIAAEALERIAGLYPIENDPRPQGRGPVHRALGTEQTDHR